MVSLLGLGRVPLLPFLDELLFLFRYPVGSGRALLAGTLPLRYCFDRFACRTPTWRLPVSGGVVHSGYCLVLKMGMRVVPAAGRRERFLGFVILVWDGNEFDSTEKKPCTPCRVWYSIWATCVEKIETSGLLWGFSSCSQEEAL